MSQAEIIYPIGVQSFEKIRKAGALYVDKTRFVWKLTRGIAPIFLSRPRRFGKSLFISTIQAYFEGKKDLFEGLEIEKLEDKWEVYPIFHLDLNVGNYENSDTLESVLDEFLSLKERKYCVTPKDRTKYELRFMNLIKAAKNACNKEVVVLIDEYDKPLLECPDSFRSSYENILGAFYSVLKSCDKDIRFSMLTGVARFGKVSIFSALNNLNDISLTEEFNDICGISQTELADFFSDSIEMLALKYKSDKQEIFRRLKLMYDGYHFADPDATDYVYNPFSLLNCFYHKHFGEYWFDSATPRYLIKALAKTGINYSDLHDVIVKENILKGVNVPEYSAESVLYQTGYLTIKEYKPRFNQYVLDFPNEEVKAGFANVSFMVYGSKNPSEFDISKFVRDLDQGNPNQFMERLKSLLAKNPYEHAKHYEAIYHNMLFVLFTLLGYETDCECHFNNGRADMIVKTNRFIYIFEFKLNRTASEALCQIADKGYVDPFLQSDRKIYKIGVNFSKEKRNIDNWEIEEE